MRLLQLATGENELIDLHPNVTVVAGLDQAGRRLLKDAVAGLARGAATGHRGLLEAHGVLFDLTPDMLDLLDIVPGDLQPIVTGDDLPITHLDPRVRERAAAEREMADVEERWASAREEHDRAAAAAAASAQSLERARRAVDAAESDATSRIQSIDALTSALDRAIETVRRLEEQHVQVAPQATEAAKWRAEVEAATAEVRERRQGAIARCAELAAQVEEARLALDPDAVARAELATATLAEVAVEVEAERAAEVAAREIPTEDPTERLERVQQRIDELDKLMAAFAPADTHAVEQARDQLASAPVNDLVFHPEAQSLADEIAAVDAQLRAAPAMTGGADALAVVRGRLDDARHALLVAEQAVRNPELDRGMVEQLEQAHAELIEAIDRADSRFGGARAQRRVEALRSAERAILDLLGFTSYSDYMMGYSLLHVDPEKEAALDAAREELSDAEDAWHVLEAETDAELARAGIVEERRLLLEQAEQLVGRPVPTGTVIETLRSLRVAAPAPVALTDRLRQALDEAGVALGDEELDRDDLLLVADSWLAEAAGSAAREEEVWAELKDLAVERAAALADIEAGTEAPDPEEPSGEERRNARLDAARAEVQRTADRRLAHDAAEARVAALAQELAEAMEAERLAQIASEDADAAVAAAVDQEQAVRVEVDRIEAELSAAVAAEAQTSQRLQALSDPGGEPNPDRLAEDVARAEAAIAQAQEASALASMVMAELDEERARVSDTLAGLQDVAPELGESASLAEEIEWYLLARLAAQRSVSLGGSLPLVLDDALTGLGEHEVHHILGRLERMAEAVQVIVITDDSLASSWALNAGDDRAAVVRPQVP
jgi:hypothetical protein